MNRSFDFEIIDPVKFVNWDELLSTTPGSSFFHSSVWARVLSESYGYQPRYLTATDGNRFTFLVPVMEITSPLTGKRGVSLPFTDYCKPIVSGDADIRAILDGLIQFGRQSEWRYLELKSSSNLDSKVPASTSYLGHLLDLSKGEEAIFHYLRDSTRRNIRKAEKEGVRVTINNSSDSVREFYRLNCMTRKLHGLPPQPYRFFENIYEHVISKGHGIVALAAHKDKNIAAGVYFSFGDKAIYKYGASDRKYQHMRANNVLMWEAIRWHIRNGFKEFCFGRTEPDNEGLLQFKRGWGAEEHAINYYKYDLKQDAYVREPSKLHGFHNKVFSKMPMPVLRITGNLLYKHIG